MKRYMIIFLCTIVPMCCFAQQKETIIDALETETSGAGTIDVESDPGITALLGTPVKGAALEDESAGSSKMQGFRILVYMGNDQRKARGEASGRQNLIKEKFSDMGTYLVYESPNWKLLVGDFTTREEANMFRQLLQKEFPQFGKEVYIVGDIVNVSSDY